MKQLRSEDILSGSANFDVPAGQYAGFALRCAGTNQTLQTVSANDFGTITATWRGTSFMTVRFEDLVTLGNHVRGTVENASASGGSFGITCFIPASYSPDGNIFDVTDDDDVQITVDLSGTTSTEVASGTIQLFGIMQDGAMAYIPKLFTRTTNIAASGREPFNLPHDNIEKILLTVLTNLDRVQVEKDREIMSQGTSAELLALSNYESALETALTDSVLIDLNRSGLFDEKLSDDITLTLSATSGGTLAARVVTVSADPVPDVLARSRATLDNRIAVKRGRKADLGKARAVLVAQRISG